MSKNTLENKAKFFAQYWGQNVVGNIGDYFNRTYLELTPLSQISDEDAIEVSERCVPGNDKRIDNIKQHCRIYAMQSSLISDYLRSKGYALPWNGITVEEQIEFGWIKLKIKEDEQ